MSEKAGDIYFDIDIEYAKMLTGSRKASEVLDSLGGKASGASKQVDSLSKSANKSADEMNGLQRSINKVASAIAASMIVDWGKALLVSADNMTQLNARIERLVGGATAASVTMKSLINISSSTGGSLQDTEKLWETLSMALKDTGATNGQILQLTDTLQKIGRIGGSSTEEMANALRQFGQSISSGTVRAEEFNSILEQMPELARQIAQGLGVSTGELRQLMMAGKLSAQDALNAIQKQTESVNNEFEKLPRSLSQAENSFTNSFLSMINSLNQATGASTTFIAILDSVTGALDRLQGKVTSVASSVSDLTSTAEMFDRRARTWSWLGLDGWAAQDKAIAGLSNRAVTLLKDIDAVTKASQQAANTQPITVKSTGGNAQASKLEKQATRRLELSKLEGEARARLQAQYDAEDAGITDGKEIQALQDKYAATVKNTAATKADNVEGKKAESQAEKNAKVLEEYSQKASLSADSTSDLSREQAILAARQKLTNPTPAQIAQVERDAAAAWGKAAALKAQNAIPELKENSDYSSQRKALNSLKDQKDSQGNLLISQEQYNQASEQLEQQHQVNLAKIKAKQATNPIADARAEVDPVQQLVNQNNQKLELMQQYQKQEQAILQQSYQSGNISYDQYMAARQQTDTQYLALRTAQENQFQQQQTAAQWQLLSQQGLGWETLTSAVDAFSGSASNAITGMLTGSMSASEAMTSLGATILNSVVNSLVQAAIQAAIVKPLLEAFGLSASSSIGASTAAAGESYAAWAPAAMAASIATLGTAAATGFAAYSGSILAGEAIGKRYNGGPVSAGGLYQVGENGKPEIYKASNGSQYMIPGDNGSVISNKDLQSGSSGAINVHVNITNQSTGASVQTTDAYMQDGNAVVELLLADMDRGGPVSSQMQQTFGLSRKANGDY